MPTAVTWAGSIAAANFRGAIPPNNHLAGYIRRVNARSRLQDNITNFPSTADRLKPRPAAKDRLNANTPAGESRMTQPTSTSKASVKP